jgi:short subunit dehydrogenase-like uncharacterized protein
MSKDHDLVLLGATGFTGRLVAGYLAAHVPQGLRVALAGRSSSKLEEVRRGLPTAASTWPLLEVDSLREADMARLAASTKVVCTTVGPYARSGLPLMAACAAAGTHSCDLTGETLFMRDSIDRFHAQAQASGARLVHSCGFDSIPSDLGVLVLHGALGPMRRATYAVESMRGGFSGGTFASMLDTLEQGLASRDRRRVMADPYALSPSRQDDPSGRDERDLVSVRHDDFVGGWTAPFVMAAVNTRVVRRSNALLGYPYGKAFRYAEVSGTGRGPRGLARAVAMTAGLGAFAAALANPLTRRLVVSRLPKPGEGPSEEARRSGRIRIRIHGEAEDGRRASVLVAGKGDPGYQLTSVMLGETALCLAQDLDRLPARAGVLTPATALGSTLVERLRAAGMTFEVHA